MPIYQQYTEPQELFLKYLGQTGNDLHGN